MTTRTQPNRPAIAATMAALLAGCIIFTLPATTPEQRAANAAIDAAEARDKARRPVELATAERCQEAIERRFRFAATVGLPSFDWRPDGALVVTQGFNGVAFGVGKVRTSAQCTLAADGRFTVRAAS